MKIKIITDSTWDLHPYYQKLYDIDIVPLYIKIKDRTYKDLIDIKIDEFYEIMQNFKEIPLTSQPTPNDFIETYKKFINDYDYILSIHISSKLSGTINSANIAKKEVDKFNKIIIYDSSFVSGALGLMATEAAILRDLGKDINSIIKYLDNLKTSIKSIFILENLEILNKGGRIGKAKYLIGSFFRFKPVLTMKNGIVEPIMEGKINSEKEIINKIISFFKENYNGGYIKGGIAHNYINSEIPNKLKKEIEKIGKIDSFITQNFGIVVTSHVGLNAIGLTFFEHN
ncbi:MAG: DegV family protein [Minisyncoccia bacterium]